MKWLDIERIDFCGNAAILIVDRIDAIDYQEIVGCLDKYRESKTPEMLLTVVRELIARARPELVNCNVWWMEFDPTMRSWKIGVSHESFPRTEPGCELPRWPLVPSRIETEQA